MKNYEPSDYEPSDTVRYCLLIWTIVSAVLSLTGNSLVLVASAGYKALKLDKISVILVNNLTVADLGFTIVRILPTIVLIFTERWIFGEFLCTVNITFYYVFMPMNNSLIAALMVSKLTSLLYPLRARNRSNRLGHTIAAIFWISNIVSTPVINHLLKTAPAPLYYPTVYLCVPSYFGDGYPLGLAIAASSWMGLTSLVIMISTGWLLAFVHKVRGLQRQGVISLVLVSIVFNISTIPQAIVVSLKAKGMDVEVVEMIYLFASFVYFISCFANPFIYYISVKSFKEFIDSKVFFKKPVNLGRVVPVQVQLGVQPRNRRHVQ